MNKWASKLVAAVFALTATFGVVSSAQAVAPTYCGDGYSVVIDGKTYKGDQTVKLRSFVSKDIQVIGTYNEFTLNVDTFAVKNYTLTGAAGPGDITGGTRTVVYVEKTPQLPSKLSGELEIRFDGEHIRFLRDGAVKMKIQAKDCTQGGIFQQEADSAVVVKNVLGAGFSYVGQSHTGDYAGRVAFTNEAVSGYDSPENATNVSFEGDTSYWKVAAGGRVGMVIGEDGVEGGAPPTSTNPGETEDD